MAATWPALLIPAGQIYWGSEVDFAPCTRKPSAPPPKRSVVMSCPWGTTSPITVPASLTPTATCGPDPCGRAVSFPCEYTNPWDWETPTDWPATWQYPATFPFGLIAVAI